MADLTDSKEAASAHIADEHAGDQSARLSVPHIMDLELDGPTLEILLAALTVTACDQVDAIDR
jgi:hypothetical protein